MEDEDAPAPQSRAASVRRFFNQVQHYKKLILKYWWIPVLCIGAGLGVETLLLKKTQPAFLSAGKMIVNGRLSIPNANVYSEEFNYFFGTQVALMQSDSVVNRVKAHLAAETNNWQAVPVAINVALVPKTSIFALQAVGENPDYVQAYLQATMEEYIRLKKDLLSNTTTATQSGMEEELNQMGKELQDSKDALINYQTSNSVVLLEPNGGNNAAAYLLSLKRQLDEKNTELLELKTLSLDENIQRLKDSERQNPASMTNTVTDGTPVHHHRLFGDEPPSTPDDSHIPSTLGGFEEAYLQTKEQLIMLKAQRDDMAKSLSPLAPDLVALNKEVDRQEELLEIYREQSQEQMENRQHTLELQIIDLGNQVRDWEQRALDVSKKLADFAALKEKETRLQAMYDQLQASLQTLDVNKGIGQESVSILESASPANPVPPEKQKHLVMAGLIGGILGFGVLFFIGLLNDRPETLGELEVLFDLPVLGQIPKVKSKGGVPPIIQPEDQRYPLVESYRSLRSALLYKDAASGGPQKPLKTIVISSAYPSEGKSTSSANFAITLAHAGSRVLLVDADLHRGSLHEFFSAPVKPGLANVFAGQCAWAETVVETAVPNLWLLPRGAVGRHAGNLFARSGKFLSEVAGCYDYVIFDSAPVLMTDDVLSLAPQADALLLVIRAGFTSGRVAKAAMDLLRLRHVNVEGLIFNAVPPNAGDYYNYRSKKYYSYPVSAE